MASRIIVFKTGPLGGGGQVLDHSISNLNLIRGVANQVPEGLEDRSHLLPAYVAEANRNTHPAKDGGL